MLSRKTIVWRILIILLLSSIGWLIFDKRGRQDPALFEFGVPAYARDIEYYRRGKTEIVRFNAVASNWMIENFYINRSRQQRTWSQAWVLKREHSLTQIQLAPTDMLLELHFELPATTVGEQHFELRIESCGMRLKDCRIWHVPF